MKTPILPEEIKNKDGYCCLYHIMTEEWLESTKEEYFFNKESAINEAKRETHFPPYDVYCIVLQKDETGRVRPKPIFLCKVPNRYNNKTSYYVLGVETEKGTILLRDYAYKYPESEIVVNEPGLEIITEKYPGLGLYAIVATLDQDDQIVESYELVQKLTKQGSQLVIKHD